MTALVKGNAGSSENKYRITSEAMIRPFVLLNSPKNLKSQTPVVAMEPAKMLRTIRRANPEAAVFVAKLNT